MEIDKDKIIETAQSIGIILLCLLFALMLGTLTSCKTIEVERRISDTLWVADSVLVRDTVWHTTHEREVIEREVLNEHSWDYLRGEWDERRGAIVDTVLVKEKVGISIFKSSEIIDSLRAEIERISASSTKEKGTETIVKTEVREKDSVWGTVGKWLTGVLLTLIGGVAIWYFFYAKKTRG